MNMIEALLAIQEDYVNLWARPIRWKGHKQAVAYKPDSIHDSKCYNIVPSPGGRAVFILRPEDLTEAWETVNPTDVNNGN
ncbi:hypothetical protein LCGC14_0145660 [marine sediment metagenome]|uniref:Uncharacterized protein n=1 Tax=marine sediment metagenome TaxID=412755 RepID=A0A0F9UZT3_9ZZZZ